MTVGPWVLQFTLGASASMNNRDRAHIERPPPPPAATMVEPGAAPPATPAPPPRRRIGSGADHHHPHADPSVVVDVDPLHDRSWRSQQPLP